MKIWRHLAIPLLVLALVSCGDNENEPADTSIPSATSVTSQIANPASEYCVSQGGTVEIVDKAEGQFGYCNLPDGRRIEEWEFYNSDNG